MRDGVLVVQGVMLGLAVALAWESRSLRQQMEALRQDLAATRQELAKPRRTGPPTSGLRPTG